MFPFVPGLNSQFFSDLYANSAFYTQGYYFVPDDQPACWTPPELQEPSPLASLPPLACLSAHFQIEPQENPTRATTRTGRTRERSGQESSVSVRALDESESASPEVRLRQKYGRNINSNIFLHMLKKIGSEEEYERLMVRAVKEGGMGKEEFKDILGKKVGRLPSYISLSKMRSIFKGNGVKYRASESSQGKEREFCRLLRTLSAHYLKNTHVLHIFGGLRIKKESRHIHLAGCRKIAQLIK